MTQTKAELLQTRHQGDLKLGDADSSHYVGFKAPATVSSSLVWILPAADGSSNQFLKTDGSGNLSWATDSATDSSKMPLAGGIFTGDVTFDGATAGRDIVFDRSDNALEFADSAKAIFGTGNDLTVWHNGTNSYIQNSTGDLWIESGSDIFLYNGATNENYAKFIGNGAVELYNDGTKKFETNATGISTTGNCIITGHFYGPDNSELRLGSADDLKLYHDGSNSWVKNTTNHLLIASDLLKLSTANGSEPYILCTADGAVELFHNNVKKFETSSTGASLTGNLAIAGNVSCVNVEPTNNISVIDNKKIFLGNSNDLEIFHDGSNSYIKETGTGDLFIVGKNNIQFLDYGTNETMCKMVSEAQVELYYNNVKKYETSTAGSKFIGGIAQVVTAAGALELDLNTSNYFTKTISGNSTFTFANPAASGQVTAFTLELTHSSGTVTWPSSVKWNADTAPTLTTGKTHLFMFVTDDGGTRYRGSALVDYVN